jgi:nuclear pore complex protein Nup62
LFFFLAPQTPSTGSAPKTPLSSSENIKFSFKNAEKSQPQLQKQTSKEEKTSVEPPSPAPNATSQYDSKPSIFGNFNGTSNSIFGNSTPLTNTNGSIFGGDASLKSSNNTTGGFSFPGFGNTTTTTTTTPSTGFQFSTPTPTSTTTTTTTTPSTGFQFSTPTPTSTATTTNTSSTFSFGIAGTSTNKPLFGNSPKFSFSDLAKQTANNDKPTSNGTEQRGMKIN